MPMNSPRLSCEYVKNFLNSTYGITGEVLPLDSYIDQNFLIKEQNRESYIFKIFNQSEDTLFLKDQEEVLRYLQKSLGENYCIPQIVNQQKIEGNKIIGPAGEFYHTRLLHYIPGVFLAEFKNPKLSTYKKVAELYGQLVQSLGHLDYKTYHRYQKWDLKNTLDLRENLKHIPNKSLCRIMEYFFMQFEHGVYRDWNSLPHGLIHGDGNDYNILFQLDSGQEIKKIGTIDFGDSVWTARICELAIVLSYCLLGPYPNQEVLILEMIESFQQYCPLTQKEIVYLYDLIAARWIMSLCHSYKTLSLGPDNEYIKVSQKPIENMLEKWPSFNPTFITNHFYPEIQQAKLKEREELLEKRSTWLAPSLSLSHGKGLYIERASMQYMYDVDGKVYLDCSNNVGHVGHTHPKIVRSVSDQLCKLNTNSRYLYPQLTRYVEKLMRTFPAPLEVCFLVNSGSEANDLALRLARSYTSNRDIVVVDSAYHGNISSLIELSSYKFLGRGGEGKADHIHVMPLPCEYSCKDNVKNFSNDILSILDSLKKDNRGPMAFFCESMLGCGGQIPLPTNYLKTIYAHIRQANGLCVADEVQVGFGRVGKAMWAFQLQNVVPDIVTLGKPMGNGLSIGAVITTRKVAQAFDNGMEYFNTYGGNPVACQAAEAVLDVIFDEDLMGNALRIGTFLKEKLFGLKKAYPVLGDIRGEGFFLGIEIVFLDGKPHPELATKISLELLDRGILISPDGPNHNVLKFKPPMVFNKENAQFFIKNLDEVLKKEI